MSAASGPAKGDLRWWHGLAFFAAGLGLQLALIGLLILGRYLGWYGTTPAEIFANLTSPIALAAQIVCTSALLAALALKLPFTAGAEAFDLLGLKRPRGAVIAAAILGVVGLGFLVDEVTFLLHTAFPRLFDVAGLAGFADVFEAAGPAEYVLVTAVVALGPGLGEEFFFRGLLLRTFVRGLPAGLAVALSSILFGTIHLDALQGTGAALIGAYLAFVALRSGSVWPGVLAHAANNLVCALAARFGDAGAEPVWETGHPADLLAAAAAITAAAVAAIWWWTRRVPAAAPGEGG